MFYPSAYATIDLLETMEERTGAPSIPPPTSALPTGSEQPLLETEGCSGAQVSGTDPSQGL